MCSCSSQQHDVWDAKVSLSVTAGCGWIRLWIWGPFAIRFLGQKHTHAHLHLCMTLSCIKKASQSNFRALKWIHFLGIKPMTLMCATWILFYTLNKQDFPSSMSLHRMGLFQVTNYKTVTCSRFHSNCCSSTTAVELKGKIECRKGYVMLMLTLSALAAMLWMQHMLVLWITLWLSATVKIPVALVTEKLILNHHVRAFADRPTVWGCLVSMCRRQKSVWLQSSLKEKT